LQNGVVEDTASDRKEDSYSWLTNSRVKNKHLVNPLKLSNAKYCPILGCQAFNPFDYRV